jgi:protein O-GlcNAc transferase
VSGLVWLLANRRSENGTHILCSLALASTAPEGSTIGSPELRSTNDVTSVPSLLSSFEKSLSQGHTTKARDLLAQLLQRHLSSDTLLRLGVLLAQQEFYSEATEVFIRCAKEYPKVFEAHYNLALAYLALQKYPEALAALEKAPQPSKAEGLPRSYLRGKILESLGRMKDAEQDLSLAFAGAPQQENYALDLGLFYLRQRAYPKATSVFHQARSFHPRSSFLLLGLSLAQFLGGHSLEAVKTCQELLELDKDFSAGRLLLGFALYQKGDFEAAENVAAAGLAAAQPHPYLYYLHAASLLKLQSKDYDRISQELAQASQRIPDCTLCYLAQSKVHQARGDMASAVVNLESAVKIDPGFEEAWYQLSMVYGRIGRREDAARAGAEFSRLKSEKANRDTEILRDLFIKTLGGQE